MEGPEEPIPGTVACEHPAGSVGTVSCGFQANYQQAGSAVTEAGDRTTLPVGPVLESANLLSGEFLAVGYQARAAPALDDFTAR